MPDEKPTQDAKPKPPPPPPDPDPDALYDLFKEAKEPSETREEQPETTTLNDD
jgi:hypothetical protein